MSVSPKLIRVPLLCMLAASLFTVRLLQPQAGIAFPSPAGGWTYIFEGDQDIAGAEGSGFTSLDGTWSHDNGSDSWDGSKLGGTFATGLFGAANSPGGVQSIREQETVFLRLQDPGDPRDYFVPVSQVRFADPSNRKLLMAHNMSERGVQDNMLDDGITLTFRARIPARGKATGSLDNLFRQGEQGAARTNTVEYPVDGDGYVTSDSGKGNFVLRQLTGGSIAFSLTQKSDTPGGNPGTNQAGFAGLTMNEFAGNQVSAAVNFGQGSATNLVALDPTEWHEFWIVLRKDPSNIGTHQAFIFVDGSLSPTVFRLTAGSGSDYSDISYLAIGSSATPQSSALDVDFVGYRIGAEFPPGALENLPPQINELVPEPGATFLPASAGISFKAETGTTNVLNAASVKLLLNGQDVSSQLTVTGSDQAILGNFQGLATNQFYSGELIISDQAGRSVTNRLAFDTFVEQDVQIVEAEDYNFGDGSCDFGVNVPSISGGRFLNAPLPSGFFNNAYVNKANGYIDRAGAAGIDFLDFSTNSPAPSANGYRSCDIVGTVESADSIRPKFAAALLPDYDVNAIQSGEWLNFTRDFKAGSYQLHLRTRGGGKGSVVRTDRVTGDRTRKEQSLEFIGEFQPANAAGNTAYSYTTLLDASGKPLTVSLAGLTTLRLTAAGAPDDLRINYLLLTPAANTTPAPFKLEVKAADNQLSLEFQSEPSRTYMLQSRQQLDQAGWETVKQFKGDGSIQKYSESIQSGGSRYYRLAVP